MPSLPDIPDDLLRAIGERHALGEQTYTRLPSTGIINAIYAIGEHWVLRVPSNTPEGIADTLTESVAVPVAVLAGVHTPELVVFDESRDILDVPYTIYERVHGETLGLLDLDPPTTGAVYCAIGRDLARLHTRVATCPDPLGRLDDPGPEEPRAELERLAHEGYVTPADVRWVERWLERLEALVEQPAAARFLHNDVHPLNIMVQSDTNDYAAIIDWGDAGWGDPALEFGTVPLRVVPFMLEGYRELALLPGDETAEARILWNQLGMALRRLRREPNGERVALGISPTTRLFELMRFAFEPMTPAWRGLFDLLRA